MKQKSKSKPSLGPHGESVRHEAVREPGSNRQQEARADLWWKIIAAVICGVVGILSANISGCIERRTSLAARCDELSSGKAGLERQIQDMRHEKNMSEIDTKIRIDSLKEKCAAKDRKIDELQRENSEQRIRLDGKEVLIEQLRNGIGTRAIADQQAVLSMIPNGGVKPKSVGVVTIQPVKTIRRKFDIELTNADRANSLAAIKSYSAHDFSNAVIRAGMVYKRLGEALENSVGKSLFLHRDFQSTIAPVFRIVAEDSFSRGDFINATTQSWLAVCLEKPHPNPFTLALHSASLVRSSSYSIGFMTAGIHESIMAMPDKDRDNYLNQIFSTLSNMGYLQISYISRDKGIGAIIDWSRMFGVQNPICYKKDGHGDLWSLRWDGFGRYSEYNYTRTIEESLKRLFAAEP